MFYTGIYPEFLGQAGTYIKTHEGTTVVMSGIIFKVSTSRCSKNGLPGPVCS